MRTGLQIPIHCGIFSMLRGLTTIFDTVANETTVPSPISRALHFGDGLPNPVFVIELSWQTTLEDDLSPCSAG